MIHKQIWTEIAEAFLTPVGEATDKQRNLAQFGLCFARLRFGYSMQDNPTTTFICSLGRTKDGFWFSTRRFQRPPHRQRYDLIRGDFATLMACMTEKEFNQLLAPKVPTKRK